MACASTEVMTPMESSPPPPLHQKKETKRRKTNNQTNKKGKKRKGVGGIERCVAICFEQTKSVEALRQTLKVAVLEDSRKKELTNVIQAHFKEWLLCNSLDLARGV